MDKTKWILCPICGNKTRTMIRKDTLCMLPITGNTKPLPVQGTLQPKLLHRDKRKDRTYYEVYRLPRAEEIPESYKEISFVCLRPDEVFESSNKIGIMCRTERKKVDGLEDYHYHQLRHIFTGNLFSNEAATTSL